MRSVFTIVPREELDTYLNNYVCATCWTPLGGKPHAANPGYEFEVFCQNEECDGTGFHSKHWAAKRLDESKIERIEVERNLAGVLPWIPKPKRLTNEQILADFGFE